MSVRRWGNRRGCQGEADKIVVVVQKLAKSETKNFEALLGSALSDDSGPVGTVEIRGPCTERYFVSRYVPQVLLVLVAARLTTRR